MKYLKQYLALSGLMLCTSYLLAQNPLIRNQFSADPSARVFNGKVYLYPSHDIVVKPGHGRVGWFCMEDYHVFSSPDMKDWTDHGVIVSQNKVAWTDSTAYSMWAPDCIERDGKYYFYFPATPKSGGRGFAVGVAIADNPAGPFVPQPTPIAGLHGIDPNVQIDKDGQAYIYWAGGNLYGAKLKPNMLELASDPIILQGFPDKGLKEGPYLFERKGIYYMTYPHVADKKTERLEYAMSNSPLGPFKYAGVIMDESESGCWTNHQSVIEFKNQWYLFYHNKDLSPNFDKNRSVRADSLFFNADGTIRKVIPTLRGVGITDASKKIQIDRYSAKSEDGASIAFLDTLNRFNGWKTILDKPNAWMRYNSVNFGKKPLKHIEVKARSTSGGTILIRTKDAAGTIVAKVTIPKGTDWRTLKNPVLTMPAGVKNLVVQLKGSGDAEIDWVSFD